MVKPIGLPRDNRTLRSKPISQFFSVVTVRSLSLVSSWAAEAYVFIFFKHSKLTAHEKVYFFVTVRLRSRQFRANARRSQRKRTVVQDCAIELRPARLLPLAGFLWGFHTADAIGQPWRQVWTYSSEQFSPLGEFYQFNLSSCIRQQNSLTAQFVSFSLSNLANIFYPPNFYNN